MNCPSRTDDVDGREGWNQSPNLLEGMTREDLNGMANARMRRRIDATDPTLLVSSREEVPEAQRAEKDESAATVTGLNANPNLGLRGGHVDASLSGCFGSRPDGDHSWLPKGFISKARKVLATYGKFIGPGFMISVAYIDPGNYATDVAAGASYRFKLLFIVLLSNIIAIYLQSLCIKLGTISGMDLAQMCRAHFPPWLNYFLYFLAECAIIATDIAEVIGTAIALNLLIPKLPLVAGCAISIVDVLIILIFYRPNGSMKGLRAFEMFVMAIVLGVVICFCIQLSLIQDTSVGEVFRGYLPSSAIIETNGLYQACGILGATVMPHSLYLGSGIVQPRLLEFDIRHGHAAEPPPESSSDKPKYRPSLDAINFCLKYSIFELGLSLFTFALFVNSAILIVAGASLSSTGDGQDASLFGIYHLLSTNLKPIAGTVFALALLFSGVSAGIVCTIAGQMVSEGALNWTLAPWLRRLITRSISITPSIIIAGAVGQEGLTAALNGTQVALSVVLPFVSAPIIYFTARNKFMSVRISSPGHGLEMQGSDFDEENDATNASPVRGDQQASREPTNTENVVGREEQAGEIVKMRNHWITTTFAILMWLIIAAMNVANLVLLGRAGP